MGNTELQIKKMEYSDLEKVKDFILEQYKKLEYKDFFIVEDIDTELPVIFNDGIVIALMKNEQILGLQALDFSKNNSDNLKEVLKPVYMSGLNLYELGWTMIHVDYRRKGYAKKLIQTICTYIDCLTQYALVATVHPLNKAAYRLYLDAGLKPIFQTKYYGYERVFMIEEIFEEK